MITPKKAVNLQIEKGVTIRDVEGHLGRLTNEVVSVNLKLPRHHKMAFFKDSWITFLISTASHGKELIVIDWMSNQDDMQIKNRFSNSLIGITSAYMADEIRNTKHEKYNLNINEILDHIVFTQNGVIEDSESGRSFVFCSFDSQNENSNFPRPFALTSSTKEEFIRKVLDFKRDRVDYVHNFNLQHLPFNHEADLELARLIFELYENTNQHGKYDAQDNLIKGVRSFSIKRHASHTTTSLISQASEFAELEKYIESIGQKRNLHFYEISISDNGMGIIDRLQSKRPELLTNNAYLNKDDVEKLNYIISNTLSSKLYPGSGIGLSLALKNINTLRGFLSLRTGRQWVYFDGNSPISSKEYKLLPVKDSEALAWVTGTNYNILIPYS